jgi:uncharacterized protein (DUF934 family)
MPDEADTTAQKRKSSMPEIIKNQCIVADDWQVLRLAEGETPETLTLPDTPTLLPLAVWQARQPEIEKIAASGQALGVWLDSNEGPEAIADALASFTIIALNFPKFTDGRAYSTARLLRERYAYTGEIRAIGDVLIDQLFYLHRCGINAFALRADQNLNKALAYFATISESYQAAADQPLPLFRRRVASVA